MRRAIFPILAVIMLLAVLLVPRLLPPRGVGGADQLTWQVYFSPDGGCTDAIVRALDNAKQSVLVQAYSFTSAPIAKALVNAKKRGVRIQAILDKSNRTAKYSSADFLAHAGVPTYLDDAHAIAHNKIIIIDNNTVITGSFNFSKAAEERNAENLLILRSPPLAARYTENWQAHLQHSEAYAGK
ncbi:MAG: phospholipase D family nuclease [Armatimonadota bacterium]